MNLGVDKVSHTNIFLKPCEHKKRENTREIEEARAQL